MGATKKNSHTNGLGGGGFFASPATLGGSGTLAFLPKEARFARSTFVHAQVGTRLCMCVWFFFLLKNAMGE